MKLNFTDKKRKFLRKVYGALSFSTALFVFQACYGTPQDIGKDVLIEGTVKSKSTNLPIKGIKVTLNNSYNTQLTDSSGRFKSYVVQYDQYTLKFEDVDGALAGEFVTKDTIITSGSKSITLDILLDDK